VIFALDMIESCARSPTLRLDYESTLTFDKFQDEIDEEFDYEDEEDLNEGTYIPLKLRQEAVQYWESGKKKKLKWQSVAVRYRFVTSERQLYRFKEHVENYGTRQEKLKQIWD
jgi:hypothetical protein